MLTDFDGLRQFRENRTAEIVSDQENGHFFWNTATSTDTFWTHSGYPRGAQCLV